MAGAPQKVQVPALEDKQHGRGSEENGSPSSQCAEASASTSEDEGEGHTKSCSQVSQ